MSIRSGDYLAKALTSTYLQLSGGRYVTGLMSGAKLNYSFVFNFTTEAYLLESLSQILNYDVTLKIVGFLDFA